MSRHTTRPALLLLASLLLVPVLAAPASAGKAKPPSAKGVKSAASLHSPGLTDPLGRKMK